jgi:hypothetical protein
MRVAITPAILAAFPQMRTTGTAKVTTLGEKVSDVRRMIFPDGALSSASYIASNVNWLMLTRCREATAYQLCAESAFDVMSRSFAHSKRLAPSESEAHVTFALRRHSHQRSAPIRQGASRNPVTQANHCVRGVGDEVHLIRGSLYGGKENAHLL